MDSISNSGVSLILNPDLANAINDHQHQHDLSTCEEEFENQEEIQQMLVNAFDSQSLSNTGNDEQAFDDEDDDNEEEEDPPPADNHSALNAELSRLQEENENLRHRLSTYAANEEFSRKSIAERNEEHEQKLFTLRLDYETKIEQLSVKTSEQQIEMFTLRQMYETMLDEKRHADQQINEMQLREQTSQEKLDRSQIECERLRKLSQRPPMTNTLTQTEVDSSAQQQIAELTEQNNRLSDTLIQMSDQLKRLQAQLNERDRLHSIDKTNYEKSIRELSARPAACSVQLQTDFLDDDRRSKQLQGELDDYKLKLASKQMEMNSLKFDYDNLQHEMNDRLSLLTKNIPTEQLDQVTAERDGYLQELAKLRNEVPELKQQMIDSFQTKVIAFKEQVKKSLVEKDNDYRKKIQQMEDEYISQYEQVLEKNKQIVRALIASKQEEFNTEKAQLIVDYEAKLKALQHQPLSAEERRAYEQRIDELARANDKCSQYIAKREQEHRQREKTSLNAHLFDDAKRKYNDEIHRLYDQISKQNQQQIVLIDDHQKQIEQLKTTYDHRYRILLDEWKVYNDDLHENNGRLKSKVKEYEKTIVQLRYHIINLQIEYLQNGGNANKILPMPSELQ